MAINVMFAETFNHFVQQRLFGYSKSFSITSFTVWDLEVADISNPLMAHIFRGFFLFSLVSAYNIDNSPRLICFL